MSDAEYQRISASRSLLQNPYAHMEELEELYILREHANPYRYADQHGVGDDEAHSQPQAHKPHSVSEIERRVTKLQREMWTRRVELGMESDIRPVDILQAEYAARLLDYSYSRKPSLGWMTHGRDRIVVGGLIDNSAKTIEIASDADPRTSRFTSAHEIGHAVLHPQLTGLHRDRPLSGAAKSRERVEYEADKFASFFLMPRKLVTEQFLARFIAPFHLQEETAYALLGKSWSVVQELLPSRRHRALALADARQFNGRDFPSLSDYFGVSSLAMAIRLEELELVEA